jgi:hypothetical protein
MRNAIVIAAAAIILMVTGVVLSKSWTYSAAPSSPQAPTTFELMPNSMNLPVAPHADAF